MKRWSDLFLRAYVGVTVVVFLLLPIALVVVFSLSSNAVAGLPFGDFTMHWYRKAFGDPIVVAALISTAKLAALAGLAGTLVGGAAAYGLARVRPRIVAMASGILALPLLVPALIVGIALATALNTLTVRLSLWTALLGHTILVLPLCFVVISARLAEFDWSIESASRDLGASAFYTFGHVTLPVIGPSIVGALVLAMAYSIDEFIVTFFTIGIDNTLPIVLWSRMRTILDPSVNALGTVILVATSLLTVVAIRIGRFRL